jgi:tRNA modification GTPase
MAGGLTQRLDGWRARLLDLRAEAEARLDFADEGDVDLALPPEFTADLNALDSELREALAAGRGGRIVREGLRVALAGPPNVGKSSLINALAQSDVAIVTDEPGTTRDVREVAMDLGGRLVILLDMAGLRDTDSKAEAEGVRRARAEIAGADLVLWLVAPDVPDTFPPPPGPVVWRIATKGDLAARADADHALSVRTGAGITALQQRLAAFAKARGGDPGISLVSRERDVAALTEARAALAEARLLVTNLELCAEALRRAGHALERLLGRMDADAVLDRLFLSFCIGK